LWQDLQNVYLILLSTRSSCGSYSEGLLEHTFDESREPPKYIRDFDRITCDTKTALDLYNEMLAIYAKRVNPAVLWYSAQAVKPGN
jgi:hypothetical protein